MDRRSLLKASVVVGTTGLAGCGAILGEKEEVVENLEAASEDLLDAREALESAYDEFGPLAERVEFDADAVHESIASARDHLDEAESADPRLDETNAEIESLRAVADALAAVTDVGTGLATVHNATVRAIEKYDDDEFDAAIDELDAARSEFDAIDRPLDDAEEAIGRIDPDALTTMDVDVEAFEAGRAGATRQRDGYSLIVDGFAAFVEGAREMSRAEEADDREGAADAYGQGKEHFRDAASTLESHVEEDVPEDVGDGAAWLADVSTYAAELAATLESMSLAQASFERANASIDAEAYDDAIDQLTEADDRVSEARNDFAAATDAYSEIDLDDPYFEEVAFDEIDEDHDGIEQMLETLDHMVTGMVDFVKGMKGFDAADVALNEERFADAAAEFSAAASHFDDAEGWFQDAEATAPGDMAEMASSLICFAGALRDASELFAEGATALDEGDQETADQKFNEGLQAFGQCDWERHASVSVPIDAESVVPTRP